jgi:hypothetical protein
LGDGGLDLRGDTGQPVLGGDGARDKFPPVPGATGTRQHVDGSVVEQ